MKLSGKYLLLIIAVLLPSPVFARDFTVPSSWEKVAEAQYGDIYLISIKGGWIAWMEKKLDPNTAKFRAPSFFVGLYRKQLGVNDIETLIEPAKSKIAGDNFILGPCGVISSGYRGDYYRQMLFPVKPDATNSLHPKIEQPSLWELRRKELGEGKNMPIRIYKDAILCIHGRYNNEGLCLIPFDGRKCDLTKKEVVLEPTNTSIYDACWDGNYILYSTGKTLGLLDRQSKKKLITFQSNKDNFRFTNIFIEDDFVYFCLNEEILRFSVTKKTLERMTTPGLLLYPIAFEPEKFIGLFKTDNRFNGILEVDLASGEVRKYDFPLSRYHKGGNYLRASSQFFSFVPDGNYTSSEHIYYCGDASGDKMLTAYKNALYLVPKTKDESMTWPSFGWTRTMRDNVKDILTIRDSNDQEIRWYRKDTFIAAAVQAVSEMAKPEQNHRHLESLVREAAHNGAKVVVLPEMAITGYMSYDLKTTWQVEGKELTKGLKGLAPKDYAEEKIKPTGAFANLANSLNIYLTVPFLEFDTKTGKYYNTVLLMSPNGMNIKHYRKLNPWPFAERGWADKGNLGNVYLDTRYGRVALLICYDINFEPPNLKGLGVDHLLYSIAWVDGKDSRWFSVNLPAIAKANNINIIGANWTVPVGSHPDWHGYGKSLIISREGKILAKTDRDIGERIIYAELPIAKK
jgi:predicted amidohydrolase